MIHVKHDKRVLTKWSDALITPDRYLRFHGKTLLSQKQASIIMARCGQQGVSQFKYL